MGDELGYYEPVPGIYGTANPATDSSPESRAALQEAVAQAQFLQNQKPGYVPPGLGYGAPAPMWPTTPGGGNPPVIGWTVQNAAGRPAFGSYDPHVGTTPDWTSDPNPAAAGSYDMNVTVSPYPRNDLNCAPLGTNDGDFFQYGGVPDPPGASGYDDFTQDEY